MKTNQMNIWLLVVLVAVIGLVAGIVGSGINNSLMTGNIITDSQSGAGKMNAGSVLLEDTSTRTAWMISHRGSAAGYEAGDLAIYYKDAQGNWVSMLQLDKSQFLMLGNRTVYLNKTSRVLLDGYLGPANLYVEAKYFNESGILPNSIKHSIYDPGYLRLADGDDWLELGKRYISFSNKTACIICEPNFKTFNLTCRGCFPSRCPNCA